MISIMRKQNWMLNVLMSRMEFDDLFILTKKKKKDIQQTRSIPNLKIQFKKKKIAPLQKPSITKEPLCFFLKQKKKHPLKKTLPLCAHEFFKQKNIETPKIFKEGNSEARPYVVFSLPAPTYTIPWYPGTQCGSHKMDVWKPLGRSVESGHNGSTNIKD